MKLECSVLYFRTETSKAAVPSVGGTACVCTTPSDSGTLSETQMATPGTSSE